MGSPNQDKNKLTLVPNKEKTELKQVISKRQYIAKSIRKSDVRNFKKTDSLLNSVIMKQRKILNECLSTSAKKTSNVLKLVINRSKSSSSNECENYPFSDTHQKNIDSYLNQCMQGFLNAENVKKQKLSKKPPTSFDLKQKNKNIFGVVDVNYNAVLHDSVSACVNVDEAPLKISHKDYVESKQKNISTKLKQRVVLNQFSRNFKLALAGGLSISGVVVANIPTSALVSEERVLQGLNMQMNALTEKNNSTTYMQTARLEKTDTLTSLFKKLGIDDIQAEHFVKTNALAKFLLHSKPDYNIVAEVNENKELLNLKAIISNSASNAIWLNIERNAQGKLIATKDIVAHTIESEVRSGTIDQENFFLSMEQSGVEENIIKQMIDIFSSNINFHHDVKKGDKFRLVFERRINQGEFVGNGRIIAAEIINKKGTHQAIWYPKENDYYTFGGETLKRSFLQTPLEVSRVTSGFGDRYHPIHGYHHQHTGLDFAAPIGTHVFSSANGVVSFVGTQRGYGRIVIIDHGKGISTRYAHLSAFSQIQVGQKVSQGDLIAFVGQSGAATGPHLHYEYRVDDVPKNPLLVLGESLRTLADIDKQDFMSYTAQTMQQIQALRTFDINNKVL
jgi:murein DD-endopeptidase MepM/ murein hydrolase activator NlpD